jgi:hypothetical protein
VLIIPILVSAMATKVQPRKKNAELKDSTQITVWEFEQKNGYERGFIRNADGTIPRKEKRLSTLLTELRQKLNTILESPVQ